ncbi:MAG: NUDIX hydrolase [Oscillospiraceae bacterium]|nr:NUDIX hydrolase [Oscillospiraceae bacterium]
MDSEQSFLAAYRLSDYDRPSVTADVAAFMICAENRESYRKNPEQRLRLLLIRRGGHPFRDCWALPGGFLQRGETVEQCALREIEEETGVKPVSILPVGVFSEPERDPRGWIISHAFVSVISEESVQQRGQDDAADAQWFGVSFDSDADGTCLLTLTHGDVTLRAELEALQTRFGRTSFRILESGGLAFDHAAIIAGALAALRAEAKNYDVIFDFLPETFTLSALQKVQETLTNVSMLPANFRRMVSGYVEETDSYLRGEGHRPAKLYRRRTQHPV